MSVIDSVPLQIYSSALLFSPQASIVRSLFFENINWVRISAGLEKNWGSTLQTFEGHSGSVWTVAFSPDGSKLASGSADFPLPLESSDCTIRIWDTATGRVEQTLEGHFRRVNSVAFSPDGSKLASGSNDYTIRMWDVATGQVEQILKGHSDSVSSVTFSPDGSKLASGSYDTTIRMWDVATGQVEQTFEGHSRWVHNVMFSSDGSKLASASDDYTIRLWDVATGQVEQTFEGHSRWVHSVAFSPDGSKLASGSCDNTIRLWDVATGQAEETLRGYRRSLRTPSRRSGLFQLATAKDNVGHTRFYIVDETSSWVTQDGSRILYLPFDYRPVDTSYDVAPTGCSLAVGGRRGRVTIITFWPLGSNV